MARKIIVNGLDSEEVRIAIINHQGILEDFEIETRGTKKNKGNIYKANVMAVEPALNAAFVDYGAEKQGFLTANDVDPRLKDLQGGKHYAIDEVLSPGMQILAQVEKDEVGSKGAVLSTFLSLAGRYTVLMPGSNRSGVSRKIEDEEQRKKIKEIASKVELPEDIGFIIRTAGVDRTRTELNRDLKVLLRLWENINKEASKAKAPSLILKEQDVVIRALRDYYTRDVDEIILDSDDAFDRASEYFNLVMPKHRSVLTRYVERRPIFHHYRIEDQLNVLFQRKVPLSNGGSIVVEPTEALVAIDVNSGRQKQKDQEKTALETNTEAAKEVARQLRLRDLGGIIVVDFIDMFQRKNRSAIEKAMKNALKVDKARVKVGRISQNGTLELTRQRIQSALGASMLRPCSHCDGRGLVLNPEAHALHVIRKLRDRVVRGDLKSAKIVCEAHAADILRTRKWSAFQELEERWGLRVDVLPDKSFRPGQHDFTFETDPQAEVYIPPEPDFGPPEYPDSFVPDDDADDRLDDEDHAEQRDESDIDGPSNQRAAWLSNRERAPEWDLPSFELLDLDAVTAPDPEKRRRGGGKGRSRRTSSGDRKKANDAERVHGSDSRKKTRRSSRGRRKRRETVSAAELLALPRSNPQGSEATSKQGVAATGMTSGSDGSKSTGIPDDATSKPKKKTSFFARLFGLK